jgi:N-methylhydantoinase A
MDDAGSLKVGPKSAGADPGPAAYGRGGREATITDAHIVLHRLNPLSLLGGRVPVDEAAARAVIRSRVAEPLGLSLEAAAEGVIRIANANMSRAIRSVSTERGYDLTQFALFAYGGAGPLHAVDVAIECGIPTVIVPQEPGTLCARGMLLSDISFDFVRSEIAEVDAVCWQRVCALFDAMTAEAGAWLARERVAPADRLYRCHIDARYQGQNFEVIVPMPQVSPKGMADFLQRFTAEHTRQYGYDVPGKAVEVVNCRLQAVGHVVKAPLRDIGTGGTVAAAVTGRRKVYFGAGHGWADADVYARARLPAGAALAGPAIVEEMSSTTLLAPGQTAKIDRIGNIIIDLGRHS